mgnify:CR=1 FL=1
MATKPDEPKSTNSQTMSHENELATDDVSSDFYGQDTELKILAAIIPHLTNRNFIDIGAEKGSVSKFFMAHGFNGWIFEPYPGHRNVLESIVSGTDSKFFPYAIDKSDHLGTLHIATDENNDPLNYFHSLQYLEKDHRVKHTDQISVDCFSIGSLVHQGILEEKVGVLKIDTEGNDLNVLKGMGTLDTEVLICEYFTNNIYSGWKDGAPEKLIAEASKIGFEKYIVTKRRRDIEFVDFSPTSFANEQWGNLIFIRGSIYQAALNQLLEIKKKSEEILFEKTAFLQETCDQRLTLITELDADTKILRGNIDSLNKRNDNLVKDMSDRTRGYETLIKTQQQKIDETRAGLIGSLKRQTKHYLKLITERSRLFIKPRLGMLNQYHPRPMVLPNWYYQAPAEDSSNLPLLSIVTPSFAQGSFIERTINSVLDQNYKHLEFIIQDGGSSDETVDVLRRYDARLTHWTSEKDRGQTHAINLGFAHATGEIMAYLNSDDLLLPGALHYVSAYFETHPEVDVVYGHRVLIDEDDQEVGRWILPPHNNMVLSWADYIPQETLFWRRRIFDKIGGQLDENFHFAMDWDLILRFREAGAKFVCLPRFLGAFRIHSEQKTSVEIEGKGMNEMSLLRKRCLGQTVTQDEIKRAIRPYLAKSLLWHKAYRLFKLC